MYEIQVLRGERWEMVASFADFDVASAVFRNRTYRQRLLLTTYEPGKAPKQDVIAEVGKTRLEP